MPGPQWASHRCLPFPNQCQTNPYSSYYDRKMPSSNNHQGTWRKEMLLFTRASVYKACTAALFTGRVSAGLGFYWSCKIQYNQTHFTLESELPSQRHWVACLTPQTFGMLSLEKITFGLALKQHWFSNNCLWPDWKLKTFFRISITALAYLPSYHTKALIHSSAAETAVCWRLLAQFLPRNCSQSMGTASSKITLLGSIIFNDGLM